MTHAMTLRLPDELYEELRREAFEKRVSLTSLVVAALRLRKPLRDAATRFEDARSGCDSCGRPHVMVSTPGGFRFCQDHRTDHRRHEPAEPSSEGS